MPQYNVVTQNCHEFVMSLVKEIIYPGYFTPDTLSKTLGVWVARDSDDVKVTLLDLHRLKQIFQKTNKKPVPITLRQNVYESIKRNRPRTAIARSNQRITVDGYLVRVMIMLMAVEYFMLYPSGDIPEQSLPTLRAVAAGGIIAQASLELEWIILQQPRLGMSRVRVILQHMLLVLIAESVQNEWSISQSKEIMEAVRQLIKSLSLTISISKPVFAIVSPLVLKDFVVPQMCKKYRKRITAVGERIMNSQAVYGERSEWLDYSKFVEKTLNDLKEAESELRIWSWRFYFL